MIARSLLGALLLAGAAAFAPALAACGDPTALGVSRVMAVETHGGLEVGRFNFSGTLPLQDMEVVLTFDDGPLPGVTPQVLKALREACAKATFFVVGRMARQAPELVRQEAADGHTVGNHTFSHPQPISMLSPEAGIGDINEGFAAIGRALGEPAAPFFRFPGFAMTPMFQARLAAANIGIFSTDVMGYDWQPISPDAIRQHVMNGLARQRGGIVLLHDIHRATAAMLPQLLAELKQRGFKLVHIVPARACPTAGCRI